MGQHKHTPAPWRASPSDAPEQGVYGCGYRVAQMTGGEIGRDAANARLIAAAPDLLAALEMALIWLDYEGKYDVQGIRAAIAKATGGDA